MKTKVCFFAITLIALAIFTSCSNKKQETSFTITAVKTTESIPSPKIDTIINIEPSKYGITKLNECITRHNEKPSENHHLIAMNYVMSFITDLNKELDIQAPMGRFDRFLFDGDFKDGDFKIAEPRKVIRFNHSRFKEKYEKLKLAKANNFILTIHRQGTTNNFKDVLEKVTLKPEFSEDKIISPSAVIWEKGGMVLDEQDN